MEQRKQHKAPRTCELWHKPYCSVQHSKVLCVVLNNMLNFNKVMKCFGISTSWGKDKESLLTTYKTVCRQVLNYTAPIWAAQMKEPANHTLPIANGYHLMTDEDHLHTK